MATKVATAAHKQELEAQRDRLVRQFADLGVTVSVTNWDSRDPADLGNAALEREQSDAMATRTRARLEDVMDALTKIDKGTFGWCEGCSDLIAPERLEVLPQTRMCVNCASKRR